MIDISDEEESTKKCYKYLPNTIGSLNIAYNASNSMICLWNKYQIFIHERLNFEGAANVIVPEFQIKQTMLVDNYLLCLDLSSNIHLISLKFKHSAAKRIKSNFSKRDNNILIIRDVGADVVSLKLENDNYYICTYRLSADFQLTRKQKIHVNNITVEKEKYLLFSYALTEAEFESIKVIFKCDSWIWNNHYMLIFSFDKKLLYGCLFSLQNDDEPSLIKLYSCSTEVSDIKILHKNHPEILIGLTSGTIIKLTINTDKSCNIVHLNTCIEKFILINDSIIYTDGSTMWKADHIFENISFSQIFVKQPKDFIKCSDQIICTTFTNFIYIFSIDDDSSYFKPITNEYNSAEHLLNNIQYLEQIVVEVKKMEKIAKKMKEQKNYTTSLALSNRQDLMDNIQYEVTVFDNYEDILKEDKVLTFTDNAKDIFNKDIYYFLISIKTSQLPHNFKDILSHVLRDLRIHTTLLTNDKIIKTNTVQVLEELKKINIVVTLKNEQLDLKTNFYINIKLVTKIPGVLDEKQSIWICIHEKQFLLTSEQFIKSSKTSKHTFLKQNQEKLEELILNCSRSHYGTIFSFMKNPVKINNKEWTYYVKLPSDYRDKIKNGVYCTKTFEKSKCNYIRAQITSEDFLKSQNSINFNIANEKCDINILNDGFSRPILKVSSANHKVAIDIRNFMSNMLYNNFVSPQSQELVMKWSLYSVVETLQRAVKDYIDKGCELEEIFDLHHTFQRNIVANLPI